MRKHKKALSLLTSILVGIGSFTGPVYAEGAEGETSQGTSDTGTNSTQAYNVDQEADPAKGDTDFPITYTFKDKEAEVAVVAWHQWHSPSGTGYDPDGSLGVASAKSAELRVLTPGTKQTIELQHFFSSSNNDVPRGNLVALVKPMPGYLVIGLEAPKTLEKYYSVIDENGNPRSTGVKYTGMGAIEDRAREKGYPLFLNWYRDNDNKNKAIDFTVRTAKVGVEVNTTSDKSEVNIGDTVTLTSTIKALKISEAKGASFSLDKTNFNEKINGNDAEFSNPGLEEIASDTWKRVVSYKVKATDVRDGKFVYSISPILTYKYTLTVSNGDVTSQASTTDKFDTTISLQSNEIQIQGNTSSVPYDGKEHSESGAVINEEFPLNPDGTADIVVGGISYHVKGVKINAATGTDVNKYSSNFDTSQAQVTTKENDEIIDVNNFKFSTNPGSLEITPASLSISDIGSPVYNGQDQQLSAVVKGSVDGSPVLVKGRDYDLSYAAANNDYKNAGTTVTVTATGKGNYTGTVSTSYTIQPRPLRVGTNSDSKIYDGKPLTAAGSMDGAVASDHLRLIMTGTQTSVGSSQNTYTIDYGNAKKASNYKVVGESIGTLTVYAPAAKPSGRTCQQDGYPAGYAWDDAQQACVLRVTSVTPSIKAVPSTGAH